ncbi:MAG: amidase family protein [Gammaproteobacteria bacterium]|nr:amidase family protein [Gammaproteobacteria bacterium]
MTELWRLDAAQIAERVGCGDVRAVDVIEQSLRRLAAVNPRLCAVVQEMPDEAMAGAAAIDAAIAAGKPAGPLAGVPVTVKVNIDQRGFANTNGLRIQRDHRAQQDHPVVENLRRAGAVIIGRTNTPAFSMRWFTRNSLHGHTRNPRNLALTPGGSSGGAASAVAAGIGALAHGTDIAGSIRYPAYACGLQGIRPTLGRVPAVNRSLPDRHIGAQLTAVSGPLARRIADLRLGLEAMAAASDLDPWWVPAPLRFDPPPRRVALCINPEGLEVQPAVTRALHEAARMLREAGWQVDETACPPLREPARLQLLLWMSEYHLNGGEAVVREDDPDANFVYAQLHESCPTPSLASLMEALQRRVALAREWQQFLTEYPLLLCPVSAELPFDDQLDVASETDFARIVEAQLTQIALPFMGMPALAVTTGQSDMRPVGVQLVAARFREDLLLDAGAELESRCPPIDIAEPD